MGFTSKNKTAIIGSLLIVAAMSIMGLQCQVSPILKNSGIVSWLTPKVSSSYNKEKMMRDLLTVAIVIVVVYMIMCFGLAHYGGL